jgi:hypothetical protein
MGAGASLPGSRAVCCEFRPFNLADRPFDMKGRPFAQGEVHFPDDSAPFPPGIVMAVGAVFAESLLLSILGGTVGGGIAA